MTPAAGHCGTSDGFGGWFSRWCTTSPVKELSGYFESMIRASASASSSRRRLNKALTTFHSNSGAFGLSGNRSTASLANFSDRVGFDAASS